MSGRARAPEAKEARRQAFLAAARSLLDGGAAASAIPMSAVAEAAGLAKGTSYLYFPSKEALFLDVLLDDLDGWIAALEASIPTSDLPEALADTLSSRPRLLKLLGELHALEAGIDVDTARAFKERLGEQMLRADAIARSSVEGLAPGQFAKLLLFVHALAVGLGPMASPAPAVATALAEPELQWMQVDFRRELLAALRAWLQGGLIG